MTAHATTVALTNFPKTPITRVADLVLTTAARETTFRSGATASRLAQLTVGHSGAELANLLNEAAIVAVTEDSPRIHRRHIEAARDKILLGRVRAGQGARHGLHRDSQVGHPIIFGLRQAAAADIDLHRRQLEQPPHARLLRLELLPGRDQRLGDRPARRQPAVHALVHQATGRLRARARRRRGAPPAPLWATDPAGFSQVGCVYTAQGFEYDWNGVIFGPDFVWRTDRWVIDRSAPSRSRQ